MVYCINAIGYTDQILPGILDYAMRYTDQIPQGILNKCYERYKQNKYHQIYGLDIARYTQ